jgi:hypothetical protein
MASNTDHNPQGGIQGTSPLYRFGTSPNTRSVVSQKIRILAPAYGANDVLYQIGVLGNFSPTESRGVEAVRSIGFGDQVAELVPGVTEPMTADVERQLLYLSNIWQSTGYAAGVKGPMRSLKHHRWPFDIRQEIVFSTIADAEFSGSASSVAPGAGFTAGVGALTYAQNLGGGNVDATEGTHNVLVTFYEACWWNSWSTSGFSRDSSLITESGSITITDVHDASSLIGEFARLGNDPSVGQLGSIRYGNTFSS